MIVTSGKRKQAVARAMIKEGNGQIKIKKKDYKFLHFFDRLRIEEPIKIYEKVIGKLNLDADIFVIGGGEKSQIEAARLALAKGMVRFSNSKELAKAFLNYDRNLLVADVRRKEAYKPGDSKA
ncbi:MAG: 30S ribosomal protein S9, partial [Nanoarchaeota archaeon]